MKKLALIALAFAAAQGAFAQTQFNLDFSPAPPDTVPTVGYQSLFNGPNNAVVDPAAFDLGPGSGITLDFSSVGSWENNTPGQPLAGDGLYVANGAPATYTLAGLAPGSTVSVYAIRGWNRGAQLSFDGGALVSTQSDNQGGLTPTVADFFLIGTATVPAGGSLSGMFTANANGDEGQLGGMIIQISAVPEPSSVALVFCGSALVAFLWYRRRIA